ncbi:outer membrane beta-barrel protein [Hymenobacter sp. HMF4947]|uniref:Outer membrane beta-barrel protein n=1 Tax=Hymenobacter ginkgonis TaxID=2682976 RepID=A0A7K1T9J2_9BACT|nr:outer membrane beta-barrel protein [Hymenobacter ginkgonis]MVN75077.1 outer membrane beta-barrel protein [Hymenobacter ginkgonis]
MPFTQLACGALLLSLPTASLAQGADPAPTPRFYGGLAFYSSDYQRLGNYYPGLRLPVQGTVGYQLRPRLAVQLGVAYSGSSYDYANAGLRYNGPNTASTYYQYSGTNGLRSTSIALLGRYTLTRKPAHRVQFDLLAGFTLEHSAYREAGSVLDSVQQGSAVASTFDERYAHDNLLFGAGPSVRYRLGAHFELLYDLLYNANISTNRLYQIQGVTTSSALGLRYRFGR